MKRPRLGGCGSWAFTERSTAERRARNAVGWAQRANENNAPQSETFRAPRHFNGSCGATGYVNGLPSAPTARQLLPVIRKTTGALALDPWHDAAIGQLCHWQG